MKKMVILCRGKSIENIQKLQNENYDLCAIVNDFDREFRHQWLSDFVKKQKEVIHYVCRESFSLLSKESSRALPSKSEKIFFPVSL